MTIGGVAVAAGGLEEARGVERGVRARVEIDRERDVAVVGSQKGLMLPTGMAFTGVSAKAIAATAITVGGARAAMSANRSPNGATSPSTARHPVGSSADANGARRVARQTRDITNGMPAKLTRAWRFPAATPFQTRGRPR